MYHSAKIDSCILGASTKIGSKAELSRCVTQSGYEVTAGGTSCSFFLSMTHTSVHQNLIRTRD